MKYYNPNFLIIVEASGGFRVLEKLGFKNDYQLAQEERQRERQEKAKEFFEKCREKKEADKEYLKKVKKQVENDVQ